MRAEAELLSASRAQGFTDLATYRAARLPVEDGERLAAELKQHDEGLAVAREGHRQPAEAVQGLQMPDLPAMEAPRGRRPPQRRRLAAAQAASSNAPKRPRSASSASAPRIWPLRRRVSELRAELADAGVPVGVTTSWRFFTRRRITLKKSRRTRPNSSAPTS